MITESISQQAVIGVDVGGTNTVIGVFTTEGTLLAKRSMATICADPKNLTSEPAAFFELLTSAIHDLARENGYRAIAAAGFGIPGWVDAVSGIALHSSNLGWRDVRFAEHMSRRLGSPVYVENDVRMYTLGEAAAGAGIGYRSVVCLTLGTGLAAGIIQDGILIRGSRLLAGEIGHDVVDGADYPCNCGKRGCLETIASASGIARLAEEAVRRGEMGDLSGLGRPITAHDVYKACAAGDQAAAETFRYVGHTLGRKLATVASLLDPEVFIIGGGVAAAGDYLLDPIREELAEHITDAALRPAVVAGKLQDSAGLIGSARFAIEQWSRESGRHQG
jgi:glucokinase